MIVGREALQVLVQAPFVEHNHMIQALATDGPDYVPTSLQRLPLVVPRHRADGGRVGFSTVRRV